MKKVSSRIAISTFLESRHQAPGVASRRQPGEQGSLMSSGDLYSLISNNCLPNTSFLRGREKKNLVPACIEHQVLPTSNGEFKYCSSVGKNFKHPKFSLG